MPYSGANDPNLPDRIARLPEDVRRRWTGAFNGAMANCRSDGDDDCEGYAFRVANAAITKKEARLRMMNAIKQVWWSIIGSKELPHDDRDRAVYLAVDARFNNPITGMGCYVEDIFDAYVVLNAAGALFKLGYTQAEDGTVTLEAAPVPVVLQYVPKEARPFAITKDATGRYRWVAIVSNRFKDRDGEIIAESAHLEFEKALDTGDAPMPELWFWHIPGSRIGATDYFTYADGFVIASGVFDQEVYGERLAAMPDLGVSHGFKGTLEANVYTHYRDKEISPLPIAAAANPWTAFEAGGTVSIPDAKMKALTELVGEERATSIAAIAEQANKELVDAGIEHKETTPVDTAPFIAAMKELTAEQTKALEEGYTKALGAVKVELEGQIATASATSTKAISDLSDRVARLELSDDAKMAALITPRAQAAKGAYRATGDPANAPTEEQKAALVAGKDWMDEALDWLPAGAR